MVFSHIYYLMDRKCWLSWTRSMPTFSMTVRMPSFPFIRKMISKVYANQYHPNPGNLWTNRLPPALDDFIRGSPVFPVGDGFGWFVFFGRFEETHFRNGVIRRPKTKPRGPGTGVLLYMVHSIYVTPFNFKIGKARYRWSDSLLMKRYNPEIILLESKSKSCYGNPKKM